MTIRELLERGENADAAIESPGRPPLDYRTLRLQIERIGSELARLGLGSGDRIAIVLTDPAQLAVSLLAVASHAAAAPLNPAYRCEELEVLLSDLGASALLTSAVAGESPHKAALALGLPILHATATDDDAPAFDIRLYAGGVRQRPPLGAGDVALLLHTSGTTSRPKLVPLLHSHLSVGAANVAGALGLRSDDRCLVSMPLFHIHGIVASVLAPLSVGGSIVCTSGFNASRFFDVVAHMRPTWTTAVPTMYHTVLNRASAVPPAHTLRLVRSSSLALPPRLMQRLEAILDVPVLEALGMTEATHQVTSNPPPPAERRPGSVGTAAGPEIAVLDQLGALRGAGFSGELVVRGPNVFEGYENDPDANARSFVDGWFRTGDLASIGADGYVRVTGRLKELINRGGEKIGPGEIEEVLLDHVAVDQAIVFPAPHAKLGEEVAAAVVLTPGTEATAGELRAHVRDRLAAFKVPRRVLIVDDIPKGPTGKPQRSTLATTFGLGNGG